VIALGIFGKLLGALIYFDTCYSKDFVSTQRNYNSKTTVTLSLDFIEKSNY
jgi:hypothetical protein